MTTFFEFKEELIDASTVETDPIVIGRLRILDLVFSPFSDDSAVSVYRLTDSDLTNFLEKLEKMVEANLLEKMSSDETKSLFYFEDGVISLGIKFSRTHAVIIKK